MFPKLETYSRNSLQTSAVKPQGTQTSSSPLTISVRQPASSAASVKNSVRMFMFIVYTSFRILLAFWQALFPHTILHARASGQRYPMQQAFFYSIFKLPFLPIGSVCCPIASAGVLPSGVLPLLSVLIIALFREFVKGFLLQNGYKTVTKWLQIPIEKNILSV